MPSDETRYTNKVFMAGALPLMKTIANDVPELKKKFEGVDAIYQVSAKVNVEDKEAVHFIIENGEWTVKLGEYLGQKRIDAELAFSSMEKMNAFMKGDMTKLPKMKIKSFSKFLKFMQVLLKMSSLLSIKEPPENDEATSVLLCNKNCIEVGLFDFNDVDENFVWLFAQLLCTNCLELFDFSTLLTDYHARLCAVDVDSYSLSVSFDFYFRNTCAVKGLKKILTKIVIFNECICEFAFLSIPARVPVFDNTDS